MPLLLRGSPLPARRAFSLGAPSGSALLDVYEGIESVRLDKVERPKEDDDDDDEDLDDEDLDEEDKFIEVRTIVTKPSTALGKVVIPASAAVKGQVRVELRVSAEGKLSILLGEKKDNVLQL